MPSITVGYVPSLEAIPLLDWASEGSVRTQSCPGYGNMVRGLLTGSLEAGLIPWELLVSDLLSRPGQTRAWKIPAIMKACPMELVLSQPARKQVFPIKRSSRNSANVELIFGVEARHSFTKRQIVVWMESLKSNRMGSPRFKVLPMKLMIKALKMGEVDGVLAPSPWGLQAEVEGVGKIERSFDVGEHGQHLVLVCRGETVSRSHQLFVDFAGQLTESNALKRGSDRFLKCCSAMAASSASTLSAELFDLALKRYSLHSLPDEFVPDASWFEKELEILVSRRAVSMSPASIREVAGNLLCA
ncbi:ABC transporter substrate-binding protein [Haloferula sp.]|uniref:ABC transporter substrate-binding protein n=1 Tax=Haloferula sp. TaxID=2497595 RepID=UPI003C763CAF